MSFQTEIDAVYEIIHGSLVHCRAGAFPGFRDLLADTLQRRQPVPESHPWLLLPILIGEALGGRAEPLSPVAAACEIGRIAAGCLDEWQDQDSEGALWRTLGGPRTVNLATAMLSLASLVLDGLVDLGVPAVTALALRQEFDLCLLRMCEGQHADLGDELALADYETVAGAKSGSLFQLGCRAGALAAGAPGEVVEPYGEFGRHLGVLAQIWNDVQGLWDEGGKMDAKRRRALPAWPRMRLTQTATLLARPRGWRPTCTRWFCSKPITSALSKPWPVARRLGGCRSSWMTIQFSPW